MTRSPVSFQLTTSRRGRLRYSTVTRSPVSFQLTTSRRGRPVLLLSLPYSFLFQLTTSRRGRLHTPIFLQAAGYFNSLPHAEVDLAVESFNGICGIFQLTTSRRGRQAHKLLKKWFLKFQLTTSRRGRQQFVTKSMDINHRFHNKSHNKSLFFALIILCLSIFH